MTETAEFKGLKLHWADGWRPTGEELAAGIEALVESATILGARSAEAMSSCANTALSGFIMDQVEDGTPINAAFCDDLARKFRPWLKMTGTTSVFDIYMAHAIIRVETDLVRVKDCRFKVASMRVYIHAAGSGRLMAFGDLVIDQDLADAVHDNKPKTKYQRDLEMDERRAQLMRDEANGIKVTAAPQEPVTVPVAVVAEKALGGDPEWAQSRLPGLD